MTTLACNCLTSSPFHDCPIHGLDAAHCTCGPRAPSFHSIEPGTVEARPTYAIYCPVHGLDALLHQIGGEPEPWRTSTSPGPSTKTSKAPGASSSS